MINLPPFIPIYPDLDPIYFYPAAAGGAPTPGPGPGAVTPTPTPAGPGAVTYPQTYPSTPTPGTPTPTPYRPKSFQNTSSASTKQTRTILIQNLSPTVSQHDLCAIFIEAGPIESSHVDASASTNTTGTETVSPTGTGTATTARITYTSVDAAKRAVALFNSASLGPDLPLCPGSKRLRVRLERFPAFGAGSGSAPASGREKDKETTVETGRPRDCQPLVVNGSGVGKRALIA